MAPGITGTDKKVFETLQQSAYEFLNTRKWTEDVFKPEERIECSILITFNKKISSDEFEGTIQVQSRRPIFKTSYNSPALSALDDNFNIKYLEYQSLEFSENGYTSNLTSLLAYYAYLIIGMDYDSYSPLAGTPYFLKAQNIVNYAQNIPFKGWKAFENTRNRYWITENLLNPAYRPIRQASYQYHRKGLDIMSDNKDDARIEIMESLDLVRKVHKDKPGSIIEIMFFNAKPDELVNIFSEAYPDEKSRVVNLLNEVDPVNSTKYAKINSSK